MYLDNNYNIYKVISIYHKFKKITNTKKQRLEEKKIRKKTPDRKFLNFVKTFKLCEMQFYDKINI